MGNLKNLAPLALLTCLCGVLATSAQAQIELITNGNFETGSLAPFVVTNQAGGAGSFYIINSTAVPGGFACCVTVGPASGADAASSGQSGPGAHALTQTFTVPPDAVKVVLSFDQFVNDDDGGIINPAGLDYTAGPNEHARVDLLTASAAPFDTGAGVLRNFYIGNDGAANPHAYTHYVFDITANVVAGHTYQIRFAEVDNQSFFNQGVDNVSIQATPGFLVSYAANLAAGDSFVNITNSGASGAGLNSVNLSNAANTTGAFCANVYAFTPDEQMVSCCSCPVTPNGLVSLSAKSDLASNTLTAAPVTALVIKLVASAVQGAGSTSNCTNSAANIATGNLVDGILAYSTTIHATPAGTYSVTEKPFSIATLSTGGAGSNIGELSRLGQLCNFIIANGSGYGICKSCRLGGLAAERQ